MANRFMFNRKDMGSIVVDEHGQSLASFVESDIVAWWQLQEGASASHINAD